MTRADLTIFVVDDDASVCRALERMLRIGGYQRVETFVSPEAFLGRFRTGEPCLLIVDLIMPGMSGIEVNQRLRELCCSVPTVFMSAHQYELARAGNIQAENSLCVSKPFDGEDLLAAVSALIRD